MSADQSIVADYPLGNARCTDLACLQVRFDLTHRWIMTCKHSAWWEPIDADRAQKLQDTIERRIARGLPTEFRGPTAPDRTRDKVRAAGPPPRGARFTSRPAPGPSEAKLAIARVELALEMNRGPCHRLFCHGYAEVGELLCARHARPPARTRGRSWGLFVRLKL